MACLEHVFIQQQITQCISICIHVINSRCLNNTSIYLLLIQNFICYIMLYNAIYAIIIFPINICSFLSVTIFSIQKLYFMKGFHAIIHKTLIYIFKLNDTKCVHISAEVHIMFFSIKYIRQ